LSFPQNIPPQNFPVPSSAGYLFLIKKPSKEGFLLYGTKIWLQNALKGQSGPKDESLSDMVSIT
jgi:hypothetical protein